MLDVNDIINSYNRYQENMLVIDYTNHRVSSNGNVKYFDIMLRKEDGLAPLKIKFFKQEVCNRIKGPSERTYEQIKICIKNKNTFTQALKLICQSFNAIVSRDTKDGKINGIDVHCTKPNTPMQISTSGIVFNDPLFWIVPACKKTNSENKDFDFKLYSLDNLDDEHSPKEILINGKPVNDSNIHKVVPKGAIVSGIISMQIISSRISFSLNTKISEKLYVKQPMNAFSQHDMSIMLA